MADLDLTEAIEAAASGVMRMPLNSAVYREDMAAIAEAAVRAAAPLIEQAARRSAREEPFNWRQVGWMDQHGSLVACHEGDCTDDGPAIWRRVYVMLTAEERAAIHGVQVGDLP